MTATVTLGSVDLMTDAISARFETFDPGKPNLKTGRRVVSFDVDFAAASADALALLIQSVLDELRRAEELASGLDDGTRVSLTWQPSTTDPIYFDLIPDENGKCGYLDFAPESTAWLDYGYADAATLSLSCAAYARGPVVSDSVSSTLTNGASLLYRASVPGDAPPLAHVTFQDVSTGGTVIQRLRVGARVTRDHASGDFDPWIDAVVASGASTQTDATAVGGSYARRALSSAWQQIATFPRPAGWANVGRFHAIPRLRDNAVDVRVPTGVSASSATAGVVQIATASTYEDANVTSCPMTFSSPITPGNGIIAFAVSANRTQTLTAPGGWTLGVSYAHVSNQAAGWMYYKENASASDVASTWSIGSATGGLDIIAFEVDGVPTSSLLDDTASGTSSLSDTPAQANELAFLMTAKNTTASSVPTGAWDIPTGATWRDAATINGAVFLQWLRSTGTYSSGSSSNDVELMCGIRSKSSSVGQFSPGHSYEIRVAAKYGSVVGPVSSGVILTLPDAITPSQAYAAIDVDWVAPAAGTTPDGYRVFYRLEGLDWYYVDVGNVLTTYLTGFAAGTQGDPPGYVSTLSEWRWRVGLASNRVTFPLDAFRSGIGSGTWEMPHDTVRGGQSTLTLPPAVAMEGSAPDDWLLILEAQNPSGQTANADVDAVCLLPAENGVLLMEYRDSDGDFGGLTAPRWWVYDQRHRRSSAVLRGVDLTNGSATLNGDGTSVRITSAQTMRATAASMGLNTSQGWFALAFKPTWSTASESGGGTGYVPVMDWKTDGNNKIAMYYEESSNLWYIERKASGTGHTKTLASGTINAGDTIVLIGSWTATQIAISKGGAFSSTSDTNIPVAPTTAYLASNSNPAGIAADVYWAAAGTGTLSDADAATILAFGTTDPTPAQFPTTARLTFLWDATSLSLAWTAEAGQLYHEGRPNLGPGNLTLAIIADVAGGASDTSTAKLTAQLQFIPRYLLMAGD